MKENNLINQYMENNKLNIEKVMDDYTSYIYTIIKNKNSCLLNEEDIEEIISDTFLAVWKNQKNLDENKEMSSYLAGIAKNIFSKKIRSTKNIIDLNEYKNNLYEIESLDLKAENNEKSRLIENAINDMKKEDKEIFMSYYYYSKSIKEIAINLKITELKVKSRLFRIRQKLKKVLEKRGYSYNG